MGESPTMVLLDTSETALSNNNNTSHCNLLADASQSYIPAVTTIPATDSLSDDDDKSNPSQAAKEDAVETPAGDTVFFLEE